MSEARCPSLRCLHRGAVEQPNHGTNPGSQLRSAAFHTSGRGARRYLHDARRHLQPHQHSPIRAHDPFGRLRSLEINGLLFGVLLRFVHMESGSTLKRDFYAGLFAAAVLPSGRRNWLAFHRRCCTSGLDRGFLSFQGLGFPHPRLSPDVERNSRW
ncbi:unnamed protein product [Symbiodinium necroappetens]|uniref:Uncharacterized protein n=1 Tax=Symbiodinium necroappetens TaxID=1628268 RepID=A0A812W163_9DINO|nr:unnamed protein product [Symbiodinium necroappetens]